MLSTTHARTSRAAVQLTASVLNIGQSYNQTCLCALKFPPQVRCVLQAAH